MGIGAGMFFSSIRANGAIQANARRRYAIALVAILAICVAPTSGAHAAKFAVLYSFCAVANCADGANPGNIILDSSGTLYGTTGSGGAYNGGTAFEMTPNATGKKWKEKVLYSFCAKTGCADGIYPDNLIMDAMGDIYGTSFYGGANNQGEVFELTPNAAGKKWKERVLYSFCTETGCTDGSYPTGLTLDRAGNLYGSTSGGGDYTRGVAFELAFDATKGKWSENVLHSFGLSDDGYPPNGGLIVDHSGNVFGTTEGAQNPLGVGTIFELTPGAPASEWGESVLYNFCPVGGCPDGAFPFTGMIADKSGNFYGTTAGGGAHGNSTCTSWWTGFLGCGVAYKLVRDAATGQWNETVLYSFCAEANCADGGEPAARPVMDNSGNIYGTAINGGTYNGGTVFKLDTSGHETVLYNFCTEFVHSNGDCLDGWNVGGLIRGEKGILYGTASQGGANCQSQGGCGVLFAVKP